MTPRKRPNFRELHWSSINIGWPPEGALHLPAVEAVRQVVAGTPGHPDQFPYVDSWLLIAQTLPLWARLCTNRQGQSRVFVAQSLRKKKEEGKKPIFQGDPVEDPLLPLPYVTLTPQALAQPAPDSLPDSPPTPPPVSPASPHEQDSSPEPGGKQLCSAKQSNQLATAHQMPLQETQDPQQVNKDSSVQPDRSILCYQPFRTTDLLNWKQCNPVYSDKP